MRKKTLVSLAALMICFVTHGQGTAQFNNRIIGYVEARFVLPDGTGAGAGWRTQLYFKRGESWQPISPATTFRTTSPLAMGYVNPIDVTVPGVAGGTSATLVMRAYNGTTFETSLLGYESNPIKISLGGGGSPPTPAAFLSGLESFRLIKAPRPKWDSPKPMASGAVQFAFNGSVGQSYTIQTSNDLVAWTGLTNFISKTATIQFVDLSAADFNRRFYRVISP